MTLQDAENTKMMQNDKPFYLIRKELLETMKRCRRCGSTKSLEVHHKIPKFLGRNDDSENLEVLCKDCHSEESKNLGKKKEAVMNPVTTYLSPDELDCLADLSGETGHSISSLIREAVKRFLEAKGK